MSSLIKLMTMSAYRRAQQLRRVLQPKKADFQSSLDRFIYVSKPENIADDRGSGSVANSEISNRKRRINEVPQDNLSSTKSLSPEKKRRQSSKYASPAKYAHLAELTDIIEPNLIGIFVGFNPGVTTATKGHAYAHPSNMFWRLLHSSGITDVRLKPEQDVDLPKLCSMGNTNLVSRPSKAAGELSKQEMGKALQSWRRRSGLSNQRPYVSLGSRFGKQSGDGSTSGR